MSSVLRSLRLHQWVKNTLVFLPIVLGGKAGDASAWLAAFLGFVALGFVASAMYVVNDLHDLPKDRLHRSKRHRPLASGALSFRAGVALSLVSLAVGLGVGAFLGPGALALLLLYVAVALSYSFLWKRVPILDALVLASLYSLRFGFGIVLADVQLSLWPLVFSMFVFLSLSMAKRNSEILQLGENGLHKVPGRGYVAGDMPVTLGVGLAAMHAAVLIMILYLVEDAIPLGLYAEPTFLWGIPPCLFLYLGRIWLLSQRGQLHDDPVVFALTDRWSLLLGVLAGLAFVAAVRGLG